MNELNFKFTIDETNLIFQALAQLSYAQVHSLIKNIETQATQQVPKEYIPMEQPPQVDAPISKNSA